MRQIIDLHIHSKYSRACSKNLTLEEQEDGSLIVTILGEDYILFAEAKGLRRNRILMKYAMRNALLPQVTGLAMSLGSTVSGSYLVEYIFVYPGVGSLFIQAVNLMDFNTIQACIVTSIFAVLTMNLFIDIFYPFVDPRIKGG